ncbi:MAG: ATP-dependent Clp protease adaptor ClpS [Marinilabiliaceae bacterium]|nr:ATP-dependent Clp protease adaptor ClpS [Marinilabiliaceae bacterium]
MVSFGKNKEKGHSLNEYEEYRWLILHNDSINTFDYVIETLCEVCHHNEIQAEQCAVITHYKGKCDIKKGSFNELLPIRDSLLERELSVTID